jgi:hypothetical protein
MCWFSWNLAVSGPVQACTGIAVPLALSTITLTSKQKITKFLSVYLTKLLRVYIVSDKRINENRRLLEKYWLGKREILGIIPVPMPNFHQKFHLDKPGTEPEPTQWEATEWPPEPSHGHKHCGILFQVGQKMTILPLIVSCIHLSIHSAYFSNFWAQGVIFCNRHGVCLLHGTTWVFNYGQVNFCL